MLLSFLSLVTFCWLAPFSTACVRETERSEMIVFSNFISEVQTTRQQTEKTKISTERNNMCFCRSFVIVAVNQITVFFP